MSRKKLTKVYLDSVERNYKAKGYNAAKWMIFSAYFLDLDFNVDLYDSKSTVSKYIYVSRDDKQFKVRFSNHKPNRKKQEENDCNFFVGVSNGLVTTTDDAIKATQDYFNGTV